MTGQGQYLVRAGSFFLGNERNPRAGCAENAVRFDSRELAEAKAAELRGRGGVFCLPWTAEPIGAKGGDA